jgi:hypothetical protein
MLPGSCPTAGRAINETPHASNATIVIQERNGVKPDAPLLAVFARGPVPSVPEPALSEAEGFASRFWMLTWVQKDSLPPVRKPVFLPFALLDLAAMTVLYSSRRHDDVFHVEHFSGFA